MGTNKNFGNMLNQMPITAPQAPAAGVGVKKPPGAGQFAYLGQNNSLYRHPMEGRGSDVSGSVWAKMLTMKPKGPRNG